MNATQETLAAQARKFAERSVQWQDDYRIAQSTKDTAFAQHCKKQVESYSNKARKLFARYTKETRQEA